MTLLNSLINSRSFVVVVVDSLVFSLLSYLGHATIVMLLIGVPSSTLKALQFILCVADGIIQFPECQE